jgi:uncharacterized membrane protein
MPKMSESAARPPIAASPPAFGRRLRPRALHWRADLWRVPLVLCLTAIALLLVTLRIDAAAAHGAIALPPWLSVGGPEDARAILSAMLGAVSTVLALIFSVALLVLSMAVSQFGPRILYRFVRDGITQVTIGLFLASFVHTLLTFVVTRQEASGYLARAGAPVVPQLTILCSVLLVITSFAFLVVFSHRTAMAIQTQNVVARIVADLHEALAERAALVRMYDARPRDAGETTAETGHLVARCVAEGAMVSAWRTGFLQEVDLELMMAAATNADAVVQMLARPGQFVHEDMPLCRILPAARAPELVPTLRRAIDVGTHRTLGQDYEFAITQLVEIALRALSSAINDTFTGLTCIDWLGDAIRTIHATPVADGALEDAAGRTRLLFPLPRFARLVKAAFDQIRQAGAGNPAVLIRLLQTFTKLATPITDEPSREALRAQVTAVWEAAASAVFVTLDRTDVERAYDAACTALARH